MGVPTLAIGESCFQVSLNGSFFGSFMKKYTAKLCGVFLKGSWTCHWQPDLAPDTSKHCLRLMLDCESATNISVLQLILIADWFTALPLAGALASFFFVRDIVSYLSIWDDSPHWRAYFHMHWNILKPWISNSPVISSRYSPITSPLHPVHPHCQVPCAGLAGSLDWRGSQWWELPYSRLDPCWLMVADVDS